MLGLLTPMLIATYININGVVNATTPPNTISVYDVKEEIRPITEPVLETYNYRQRVKLIATAYDNCLKCSNGTGITASGIRASRGHIAITKDIPFNTKFYIPELKFIKGDGIFLGVDRGSAIKRVSKDTIKIDVWLPTHKETVEFGVKVLEGFIIIKKD